MKAMNESARQIKMKGGREMSDLQYLIECLALFWFLFVRFGIPTMIFVLVFEKMTGRLLRKWEMEEEADGK